MVKRNNESSDVTFLKLIELISLEAISDVDLKLYLIKFPEFLEKPELFKLACKMFRSDYIECFLKLGIKPSVIKESQYKQALLEAGQKFLVDNKKCAFNKTVKFQELNNKFIEIDNDIKKHLNKFNKTSKR